LKKTQCQENDMPTARTKKTFGDTQDRPTHQLAQLVKE
jgi:hypothetical protein